VLLNLSFRDTQSLEIWIAVSFSLTADRRLANHLPNFRQAPTMRMLVWSGRPSLLLTRFVPGLASRGVMMVMIREIVRGSMVMLVRVIMLLTLQEHFTRKVLLPVRVHIDLGGGNPAADNSRHLQPRTDVQRCDCILQQLRRHSDFHQSAQKHVATDAGKAI
jgi:hypothetical protein